MIWSFFDARAGVERPADREFPAKSTNVAEPTWTG
jgi:hypothetical protein